MRMVATYLEKAILFQQMAAEEDDPKLNANLHGLAEAYRMAAALRKERLNLQEPPKEVRPSKK